MSGLISTGIRRLNQGIPAMIAALSSAISLVLTIRLCQELRADGGLLTPAIGLCLEAAKLTFAILGCSFLVSKASTLSRRCGGLLLCALSLVLIGTSLAASLGYFLELDGRGQAEALSASREVRAADREIDLLDRQIAALSAAAEGDTAASYRTRALDTLARAEVLTGRRAQLAARLASLQAHPEAMLETQSGLLGGLAAVLDLDPRRVRLIAYGVIAALLELVAIAAYLLVRSSLQPNGAAKRLQRMAASGDAAETPQKTAAKRLQPNPRAALRASERGDTGTRLFRNRFEQARALIVSGKLQPSLRALQREMKPLGQRTAARFLRALLEEGILCRDGKNYVRQAGPGGQLS
jgi:phage shock protein PspC (stress-responsive transcriptional regulator)